MKLLTSVRKKITILNVCLLYGTAVITGQEMENANNLETATIGGGCFWCVEAILQQTKGVIEVKPGYSGGKIKNPRYKEVCSGLTGHAEVVQVQFNPSVINYVKILEIFWKTHDPTTPNQQGNDVGTQYRSIILYHNEEQHKSAVKLKQDLEDEQVWDTPIVTEILPFDTFYPAEDYHDNYYSKNPTQPYCSFVITPKVKKFEKLFENYVK